MILKYNCPKCQETYILEESSVKQSNSLIPTPDASIFKKKFQDHGDHTIFLHFEQGELKDYQIVPQVRSVFDTLLFDNIQIAKIINTIIANKEGKERYMLLYITDHESYLKFFQEITKIYVSSSDQVTIRQESGSIVISHSHLDFVLADFEIAKTIIKQGTSSVNFLNHISHSKLRSLLIDTSVFDENDLLKRMKKAKFKFDRNTKLILTFDSRKIKQAPLQVREFANKKYKIASLEVLNYQDTNGLKSIFLQSYYNLLDDPMEGREAFEIIQKSY